MQPGTRQIEVVPLRGPMFTANVNNLLEAKPGNLLIEDLDFTDFETEGRVDCTITLKHPLPGLDAYHGFDVWGVFMHNGATALDYDGLTYSGGPNAGQNEAVLLNPDGLARWFNYTEFDGDGLPLFEYWPGRLSNLHTPTATLNPYKVFADGLDEHDDFYEWATTPGNADDRGIYRAGMVHSRRYELKFPIIGGTPVVDFQYAVIATWEPGDPALTGNPSVFDPFDFPSSANCEEPFLLSVTTTESELYNDGQGDLGGDFRAEIEVFDWQGGSVGERGVPNEIHRIIIEGDFLAGGTHEFSQAELAAVATPSTVNSSVFQVEITNCAPQAGGEAGFWLIVESAGVNGESYYQGFPTEYPEGARRAAFLPGTVTVLGESPLDVIYVDDSNTSGIEDGTQAHPYNTVQEGVDAAALLEGYEVWVDDSGDPYAEQVNMASGTILRSVNWDESDGGNRAFIDGPTDPDTHSVHFDNVDNAILDGFRIGFAGPCEGFPSTQMIRIDGGSEVTVQDCLFTGQTDMRLVYPVTASGVTDATIAHCRIASIDRGLPQTGYFNLWGLYTENCPGLIIRNNVFTDIRSTADDDSKNLWACFVSGSTDLTVKNNLIHHIIPHAGVGSMGAILLEGFHIQGCYGVEVANNTVDSLDSGDAFFINQCFAFRLDGCNSVDFANNIATHIYATGFPQPLARGIMGIDCTVVCDFTDVYDIGPGGNGAAYYGGASPGIGAIGQDPLYIDPDNEEYDIAAISVAQMGDPSFVDWDDSGPPSNDPDDTDPETRSRMGCHGGQGGEIVGLLTPE